MTDETKFEGINLESAEAWLSENVESFDPPYKWKRLTGGTSNLTYAVESRDGKRAVVRRPPTGKLLPKAHDMGREFKIISGLAPTSVPVAQPMAYCTDIEVTGAPFYVMEFCHGNTVRETSGKIYQLSSAASARVGESIIDALVELHALDPAEIGLGDLGRPDAYIARQLNRWFDSWKKSDSAAQIDLPQVERAYDTLSTRIPEQGPGRVVHGDYAPHNLLVDDEGQVVCITDWEISTLGDPLADLTYLVNSWSFAPAEAEVPYREGRLDDDYASRAELLSRYEEKSGRSLKDLQFYIAFNYFKSTCIQQGVYARFKRGVRSTQGLDLEKFRQRIVNGALATEEAAAEL